MSQSTPPVLSQAPSSAASSPTWASWIWSWAWWWVPSSLAHAFLLLAVVTVCVAALIVYTESARKKRSARSSRDSLGPRRRVVTELTPPSITSPRPAHTPGPTLERPDNLRQRYPQLTQSLGSTHFGGEPRPTFAPPQSARPRPSDSRLPSYANNPLYQSHIDAANSFAFTPTRPLPKVEYRESVDPALLRLLEQQKHQRALAISSRSQRADQLDEPTPIPNRASTDRPAVQEQVGEERPRISRARSEAFDFEAPYDRMDDDDDRPQGFGSRRAKRRLVQEDSLDMDEMEQGDAIRRSRFGHERSNNLTEDGEEGPPKRRRHVLEIFAEERRQKKENRGDVTPLPKRLEKTGPGVSSVKRLRSSVVASKTPVRRREMAPVPTPKQGSSVSRSSSKRKQIALVDDSEDDQDLLALEQDMPPEDGWITPAAYMARRKRRKQIPSEEVKDAEVQTQATNGEDEPSTEPKVYYNPVPRVASVSTPRGRVRLHATPIKNLKEREMRITKMPTPFNRRGITSEEVDAMIRETMERDAEEDATTLPSAKKRVTFSLSQKAEAEPSPSKDTGGSGASQSETTNDPSSAAGPGLFAASKGLFTSAESSAPSTSAFSVGVTSSPPKGSDKTLFGSLNKSSGADSSTAPSGSSSVFQNLGPTPSFGSSSGLAKTSPVASSTASAVPSFNFAPKPENSSGATPAVVTANSSQEKQQEPAKDQVKESQGPTSTAPVFNFTSSTSAPLFGAGLSTPGLSNGPSFIKPLSADQTPKPSATHISSQEVSGANPSEKSGGIPLKFEPTNAPSSSAFPFAQTNSSSQPAVTAPKPEPEVTSAPTLFGAASSVTSSASSQAPVTSASEPKAGLPSTSTFFAGGTGGTGPGSGPPSSFAFGGNNPNQNGGGQTTTPATASNSFGANLSSPNPAASSPAAAAPITSFSFGSSNSTQPGTNAAPPTSSTPQFGFGSSNANASGGGAPSSSTGAPSFSFGGGSASQATGSTTAKPPTNPGFSFGGNTSAQANTSSTGQAVGTTPSVPLFGGTTSQSTSFFGSPATTATPIFGGSASTASPFGQSQSASASIQPTFGQQQQPSTAPAPTFAFGQQAQQGPQAQPPSTPFGGSSTAPSFFAASSTPAGGGNTGGFGFGSTAQPAATTGSGAQAPSFGVSTGAPSFFGQSSTTASTPFGQQPQQAASNGTSFQFGQTSSSGTPGTGLFGQSAAGSSSPAPAAGMFGQQAASTTNTFQFGSSSGSTPSFFSTGGAPTTPAPATNSGFSFGGGAASPAMSMGGGSTTPSFQFGGGAGASSGSTGLFGPAGAAIAAGNSPMGGGGGGFFNIGAPPSDQRTERKLAQPKRMQRRQGSQVKR